MTLDEPLISVLIPAYNREAYIEQCIRSALDQPFRNLEVIVSDNGSSDGTVAIVRRLQDSDPRLRLICQKSNLGPLPNWRACLDAARGRFIHWLWSDDFVGKSFYTEWARCTENGSKNAVFLSAYTILESDRERPPLEVPLRVDWPGFKNAVWGRNPLRAFASSPATYILPADSVRRNFLDAIPKCDHIDCTRRAIGPDFLMIVGAIRESGECVGSNKSLAYFRSHEGSITVQSEKIVHEHYAYALAYYLVEKRISVPWWHLLRLVVWAVRWRSRPVAGKLPALGLIKFTGNV